MAKVKAKRKPAKSETSGAAKLRASGRKAIMLSVEPWEYECLKRAATQERRPLAQFCANAAVQAARVMGCEAADAQIQAALEGRSKKGGA